MERKREFNVYCGMLNQGDLDHFERTVDTSYRSFYNQSSIIFKHISILHCLINEEDMRKNFARYGHESGLKGLLHRQNAFDRIGVQTIINDVNQAGEAVKLIHEWLNKKIQANKASIFNISTAGSDKELSDDLMNKKGVIACLYHLIQQVTDKIKHHETVALETKSQLHKFTTLLNVPINALEQYDDIFIPSNAVATETQEMNSQFNLPSRDIDKTPSQSNYKNSNKDKSAKEQLGKQIYESDLLVQQNEQLAETLSDISQDMDIVASVQTRLNEISTMFIQFSTTLNDQLDIFENIRDNVQLSIGNMETTEMHLKKSLEKEFSIAVSVAYFFLITGMVVFLLDFSRWF